jgi:hypothetical protein
MGGKTLTASTTASLTYNGSSLYRTAKAIYYVGLTPNSLNVVELNGLASKTVGTIPLVTEKTPYKCVDGVAQWKGTAQTSVFQTSVTNANGSITVKNIYYPPSSTGGAFKQGLISYTATLTKNLKPNACGFIVTPGYANSQKKTSATLSINGSSINVASLPINPNPPDCMGGKTLTGSATAVATFGGASLYRTTKAIYFAGLTPQSLNVVGYDALSSKTVSIANTCGMATIKYSEMPTGIKVGANTYTPATMSLSSGSLFYTCTSPGYAALTANTLYKVNGIEYVYKTADLTLKKLVAEHPIVISKNIPVNACGFAVIPALNMANGFTTGDKVTINGSTPYSVTTLPLAPTAPTCKNGVTYLVSP